MPIEVKTKAGRYTIDDYEAELPEKGGGRVTFIDSTGKRRVTFVKRAELEKRGMSPGQTKVFGGGLVGDWHEAEHDSNPTPPKKPKAARSRKETNMANLKFLMPLVQPTEPDIAAAWDIAEGIVAGLVAQSGLADDIDNARAEADAAFARARGEQTKDSKRNQQEYDLGEHIAKAVVYVMLRRGFTAEDWAKMMPKVIASSGPREEGLLSTAGDFAENFLSGISMGILDIDIDGDGDGAGGLGMLGDAPDISKDFGSLSRLLGQ